MCALRADSYGSTGEVRAFVRHLLDGLPDFGPTTVPTHAELEKFIDRASGALNVALARNGLQTPIINTTAKLTCDDWVVTQAAAYVELTQRGAGHDGTENTRPGGLINLHKRAMEFAKENALGFKWLGVPVTHAISEGLVFTGETAQEDRADPDDNTLEQPFFRRNLFDADATPIDDVDRA